MKNFDYETIERKIGVSFNDKKLLAKVFTHTSYANEKDKADYQNLEFLGDSILGFVIADLQYKKYGDDVKVGILSPMRSRIVENTSLIDLANSLGIAEYLNTTTEKHKSGDYFDKEYGDIIEALIAGVYIDKGFDEAKKFIERVFVDIINREMVDDTNQLDLDSGTVKKVEKISDSKVDYKTKLQELLQKKKSTVSIEYKEKNRTGEDHNPVFTFICEINGENMGQGTGKSKKIAQAMSAKVAIENLEEREIC